MNPEKILALVSLVWLVASVAFMAKSKRHGQRLAEALAMRHPELYEELGRPAPTYFESVKRNRFARFVGRREFENRVDPSLVAQFEAFRKSEARAVMIILGSGALLALLVLLARHFR